jgi:hypothetical protein
MKQAQENKEKYTKKISGEICDKEDGIPNNQSK